MVEFDWGRVFIAAVGGGVTVKILDILHKEFTNRRRTSKAAEEFVDEHLDLVLKSADELAGKLRSLAESDFDSLRGVSINKDDISNHDFGSLIYLFGQFWARIEVVRVDGMSVRFARDPRGANLQKFFDCLESRNIRIISRILQRATGEAFLNAKEVISYLDFIDKYETSSKYRRWIFPIANFLSRTHHTTEKQRLLQYGVVIHSMIDTLDPEHLVTRERPPIPGKLTNRSRKDLKYRVFGVYLKFVPTPEKYYGPPKKRRPVR